MTLRNLLVFWCVCLFMGQSACANEVILANLQVQESQTHVELLLQSQAKYRVFTLDNPYRVVLDLEGVSLNAALKALPQQLSSQHPYLSRVRVAAFGDTVTRIVFDIKTSVKPLVTDRNASRPQQQRLAMTIAPASNELPGLAKALPMQTASPADSELAVTATSADKSTDNVQDKASEKTPEKPTETAAEFPANKSVEPGTFSAAEAAAGNSHQADMAHDSGIRSASQTEPGAKAVKKLKPGQRLITIAVDAGHGGEDPGAKGANGSQEKEITLAIAQRLKSMIDAEELLQAVLIREGDYFVPLGDRVKKARAAKADLFISIHADSFVNSSARGSSVFALSERGATSVEARYLAKMENAADLIGGVQIDTKDRDLARTLLDLSQTATIHDSIRLGKEVLKRIGKINSLHSKYVEQAAFAVLKSPDIPSILVETAFISNPEEEARLNDDAYRDKLVMAILGGIKSYIATNPAFAKK